MITKYDDFNGYILFEHAQITKNNESVTQNVGKIYVYGCGDNGATREHNPPHFHLVMRDKTVCVEIPSTKTYNLSKDDIVIIKDLLDNKITKLLVKWLKSKNNICSEEYNTDKSNLFYIASIWNDLNLDDNNVSKIDLKVYDE